MHLIQKMFVSLSNSSNIVSNETSRKVYKCITYIVYYSRKALNFNTILVALKINLVVLNTHF